mmetsp:Transcript_21906/g.61219  ORF Transcript_21906/g.61219 Transcript_21906/m.61219 type:complete len:232 (+) Transcript_21906:634-1329(+)
MRVKAYEERFPCGAPCTPLLLAHALTACVKSTIRRSISEYAFKSLVLKTGSKLLQDKSQSTPSRLSLRIGTFAPKTFCTIVKPCCRKLRCKHAKERGARSFLETLPKSRPFLRLAGDASKTRSTSEAASPKPLTAEPKAWTDTLSTQLAARSTCAMMAATRSGYSTLHGKTVATDTKSISDGTCIWVFRTHLSLSNTSSECNAQNCFKPPALHRISCIFGCFLYNFSTVAL